MGLKLVYSRTFDQELTGLLNPIHELLDKSPHNITVSEIMEMLDWLALEIEGISVDYHRMVYGKKTH